MSDSQFLKNPHIEEWVVLAPRRAKRPDGNHSNQALCPFCIGREQEEPDVYRVGGEAGDANWQVRVMANRFPFAPIHEVIIHSPDHHKNFDELPLEHVETIVRVYRERFRAHQDKGQVVIFNNHGEIGGESLPHPHTQLAVVPSDVKLLMSPRLEIEGESHETDYFQLFCPDVSQWPDETWIAPKQRHTSFAETEDEELSNLALTLQRLIQIFDVRHGHEFPFNFYIYPGKDWYLRLVPRMKTLGGFEIATNIFVNTQSPKETIGFIKTHFDNPDIERIQQEQRADYARGV